MKNKLFALCMSVLMAATGCKTIETATASSVHFIVVRMHDVSNRFGEVIDAVSKTIRPQHIRFAATNTGFEYFAYTEIEIETEVLTNMQIAALQRELYSLPGVIQVNIR